MCADECLQLVEGSDSKFMMEKQKENEVREREWELIPFTEQAADPNTCPLLLTFLSQDPHWKAVQCFKKAWFIIRTISSQRSVWGQSLYCLPTGPEQDS